ncbi:sporulation YhaL family protein [Neobacillus terrae]|uniref:sporulation YhaL family protein n=1 Tax=Neobacillus terrae TaxID=3034837 RepID=UPI00140B1E37|nr:sporulation YhaL family protein [Neobacillus terrae]NHM31758.1 SigE-dependent sporulation protein [Neobacillus terrae]
MIIPIWVYAVVIGIIISAFMALKTAREDREIEKEIIEREGEIYITRLNEEKEKRGLIAASDANS